jgi:hypothetical protein
MRRLSDYGAGAGVSCMGDLASSEESSSGSVIHTASDAGVAGTAPEIENCLGHKQTNARTVCGAPSHSKCGRRSAASRAISPCVKSASAIYGTAESADAVSR